MLTKLKSFLIRWFTPHYGQIKCDVCGEWGTPNPNYSFPTFVHFSRYTGGAYMHHEHIVKETIYDLTHAAAK